MADTDLDRNLRKLDKDVDKLRQAQREAQRRLEEQQNRNKQQIEALKAQNERAQQQNRQLLLQQQQTRQEIDGLKERRAREAQQYTRQLRELSAQYQQGLDRADRTLAAQHARQMAAIEAGYNQVRRELDDKIRAGLKRLEEMQKAALEQQSQRIAAMERRLDEDENRSRQLADQSINEMQAGWQALQQADLRPFVEPHSRTYQTAETHLKTVYDQRQYQAVIGIAVNSRTLIQSWKDEAETLREERQEVIDLCRAQAEYMGIRLADAAERQAVSCDGTTAQVALQRYDEEGFREMNARYREETEKLSHSDGLTLQQARELLAEMETCRAGTDQLLTRVWQRHQACVRRGRCKELVKQGMRNRQYGLQSARFINRDFQQGILMDFCNKYQGEKVRVCIRTPDPATGQTSCQVTLLGGNIMDSRGQRALCQDLSRYISGLLGKGAQDGAAPMVRTGNVYREQGGSYRSEILVQMR